MSADMEEIEFSDMHKHSSRDNLINGKSREGRCYVSTAVGFLLVLLAIATAVGVGLIVHFAGGNREVICNCPSVNGGQSGGQTGGKDSTLPPTTPDPTHVKGECKKMAADGDADICTACASQTTTTTPASTTTTPKPKVKDVRIPLALYPMYYDLELRPNMYEGPFEDFTFDGYVRIQLRCDTPTNNVTLHTNKLNITAGSVELGAESGTATAPSVVRWEWDKDRQFTVFHLDAMLTENRLYYIKMNFTGPLKGDLHGLYLSSYESNNITFYQASTQFSPTDARKAFPCFDEPSVKSYFNITLVRKNHMKSLSNMPVVRTEDRGHDWIADVYDSTPKMATYVLAFIVCDFDFINATTKNNISFRAWSRPETVNQTRYALDLGVTILTYFEEYFQIRFPLPKQDMIAIPDISVGGMENWGLITYRESLMLYEPDVSSEGNKQRTAAVVSHEVAHQWFGDLVSPSWWDDLWLKEGFASFLESKGVDYVHPDWKMFDQFAVADQQYVFGVDGLVSSHPVYVPVSHPDEISEIFDSIAYNKGACMIRMMQFILGEETFRRGLIKYLERKAYDSAFHDELWQALTEQSVEESKNITVKEIMDTWLLQMNYPVVMVTRESSTRIRVTQQRYLQDPSAVDPGKYTSKFGYKWEIPFTFTSSKENNFNKTDADIFWIHKTSTELTIDSPTIIPVQTENSSWILGNPMQYGYYRVNYETENWQALINQLRTDNSRIHPINRAQIINDAWNLAHAGMLPQEIALQTVEYLDQEMDYVPWSAADKELGYVRTMLTRTMVYGAFQEFMKRKITTQFNTLGMNDTGANHLESFTRSLIVSRACQYGIQSCIDESIRLYRQWMNSEAINPIDPDLRSTVCCTAIHHGGVAEWDFAFRRYKSTTVAVESSMLLEAMACSGEPWILSRFLARSLVPEKVRKQDALAVVNYVSENPVGQGLAWDFFRNNWDKLREEFGSGFFAFPRVIGYLTRAFNTQFDLEQLQQFMASHPDQGSGTRAFQQAVEKTQTNIKWMDNNLATVITWLTRQGFYHE